MRVTGGKRNAEPGWGLCKEMGKTKPGRNEFVNSDWPSWLPGSPLCITVDVDSQREEANFSSHITALGQTVMIGWSTKICVCV